MASRTLPGLGLNGFWNLGEDGWNTGADQNWLKLSTLSQLTVIDLVTSLPGSPTNGMVYIITTGVNANSVAVRDNGAWTYFAPSEGWRAWSQDDDTTYVFDGSAWVDMALKSSVISLFSAGVMDDAERLTVYLVTAAMTIPAGAVGSLAHSEVTATGASSLPLSKVSGGVTTSIGTVDFSAGVAAGVVVIASDVTLAVGDRLIISAPATADATLADVSISIKGTLT